MMNYTVLFWSASSGRPCILIVGFRINKTNWILFKFYFLKLFKQNKQNKKILLYNYYYPFWTLC
jgi:hypothetical protein